MAHAHIVKMRTKFTFTMFSWQGKTFWCSFQFYAFKAYSTYTPDDKLKYNEHNLYQPHSDSQTKLYYPPSPNIVFKNKKQSNAHQ